MGNDSLYGGSGDDVLHGGSGRDALYGGAGEDTASYAGSSSRVIVSLLTGRGSGGDASGDTLAGIEHLEGSDHADSLTGDAGSNRLWGGAGRDHLYGGDGDDVLHGGADRDYLYGGTGGDVLHGGAGADVLYGDDGDDVLYGGTDRDYLYGGTGDDVLHGGSGNDHLDGGAGEDTASWSVSSSGVTVSLVSGTGSGGDAAGDRLEGIEHLEGSAHNDSLTGDAGSNRLWGGAGRDHLYGGDGDDVLHGGSGGSGGSGGWVPHRRWPGGGDLLYGGAGEDTASWAGSSSGVNVSLVTGRGSGGDASGDRLYSIEHLEGSDHGDILAGDAGSNRLAGGAGADRLTGNAGDDVLRGGAGADSLEGGAGNDIYGFGRGDGADMIDNRGESGSDDVLEFDSGIDADQLWFSRSGDDLAVRIVGTQDSVTIEGWYDGADNRLDFELSDGRELAAEDVRALVDAMAAFTPPGAGETGFTPAQHAALDSILAANWQTPA